MRFSVVIPVYNEERSIRSTIGRIRRTLGRKHDYEIITVDDGSTDRTARMLSRISGIKVLTNDPNRGYGASLKRGIDAAKNNLIVMLDADGTYPPEEIPALLKHAKDFDLVTGARTKKGAHIPLLRKPAKLILSMFANFLTGQKIPDLNCGLRVIKRDNVKKFWNLLPQRFSFTITHLLGCLTSGDKVKFVPIRYERRSGKSSIHPIKDFIKFNTIIFRVVAYFNPLRFFVPVSILMFIAAIIVVILSVTVFTQVAQSTIMILSIGALQTLFFGIIADLIVKQR